MRLRDYQSDAIDSALTTFEEHRSGLMVMATGMGKTVTAVSLLDLMARKRVLWVAHRDVLVRQAKKTIEEMTDRTVALDMGSYHTNETPFGKPDVVCTTVQTQHSRKTKFDPDEFDLVIFDECHRSRARSYMETAEYYQQNPDCKLLGLTATPDRNDGKAMGRLFSKTICNYNLKYGVDNGWLVPIRENHIYITDLDFSKVRSTAGDLNGKDLGELLEDKQILYQMAAPLETYANGRQGIIYTRRVHQAEMLCEVLKHSYGISAEMLSGSIKGEEREGVLWRFSVGDTQLLVNVGVLTEGYDAPGAELICMGRPTESRNLYTQMAGRGSRPVPGLVDGLDTAEERKAAIAASAKPHMEILDYVGNAGKHHLITTADILGGDYADIKAREKAKEKALDADGAVDPVEMLEEAEQEVKREEEKKRVKKSRKAALTGMKATATYSLKSHDPFNVLDNSHNDKKELFSKKRKPSKKMLNVLRKFKVDKKVIENVDWYQAKRLIGTLISRAKEKKATYKQAQLLGRFHVDANDLTRKEASRLIDEIKESGWKRPEAWNKRRAAV